METLPSTDPSAPNQPEAAKVTITLKPAGPIIIEGPVKFFNNAGDEVVPPPSKIPGQIKLCGCGFTKTRPFCDGSHNR
ncbi:MAG TPA: CDGSH iron-sulfur domain-containing protein [Gemmatimonadales bacterium]|nr:CDGSH iron-sulfur domain-containing protein [Gemmatimonadales bacterium]